jgi:leader peptidase (prepilin peptidase)/N-methyltransferase
MSPEAAGLGAVVSGVLALAVPTVVARVPEPEAGDPDDPTETYAAIAALPGLAWKSAVAAALLGAAVGAAVGLDWPLLHLLPLVALGVALAVVDWRTRLLPTRLIAPAYVLVVASLLVGWFATGDTGDLVRAGLGWLLAGGFFLLLWFVYPAGLGYGDVRLSGVLGLALGQLGWAELVFGVWAGFLLGGVVGLLLVALRLVDRRNNPFGPWMLLGALLGIVWGPDVASALYG